MYVIEEEVEPFEDVGVADSQAAYMGVGLFIHDGKQLMNELLLRELWGVEFVDFGMKDFDTVGVGEVGIAHIGVATLIISHSL